jgi:5-methylthioadenosine/S-adenosylhomocysteine deaminase
LEPGKKADLVLVDLEKLHCTPDGGANIYAKLVYQARGSDVALTMVDGKIVYEGNRLTTIDEADVIKQSNRLLTQVQERAGIR